MQARARFRQYQASMRADMLREISSAKKAALLKIVDSGTVTPELRQRAVKIAAVEDEMYDLKKTNSDLRSALAELDLKFKSTVLSNQRNHEEQIEMLEAELSEKSKSWAQQADMDRREFQRQQELTSAQTAASKLVGTVTELRCKLEASEDSKRKLHKAKIRNEHTMAMLEKQMSLLTAQLGGANNETIAAASAAAEASLSVDLQDGLDGDSSNHDRDSAKKHRSNDHQQQIESARMWSEKVLEKRNANHVTSLQRQLQRAKEQHRQTTDMLRRAMNRIRKMEAREEEFRSEMSKKIIKSEKISSSWSDSKEESLLQAKLEARKKGEELIQTRAQLGAVKEEHARLLEYLRARGITAPGGDISSSSAMRYMSGFSSQTFSRTGTASSASIISSTEPENDTGHTDQPYHRRSFKFSVAPAEMKTSMWQSTKHPSDSRNRSGFMPQNLRSTEKIKIPNSAQSGDTPNSWRKRIGRNHGQQQKQRQRPNTRPQSAPGRRRNVKANQMTQRETTLKMIETMIGSVKKQEEDARSKAREGNSMKTVRPELEYDVHGTVHETDSNTNAGRKTRKLKKRRKKRQKRPQSAAGVRSRQTRMSLVHSAKFDRTSTSPRLGISSEHHTRK